MLKAFPRPPDHHKLTKLRDIAPEPEVFPLSLEEVVHHLGGSGGRGRCSASKQVHGGGRFADRGQLIRASRAGRSARVAESDSDDKVHEQQLERGIPIPGATTKKSRRHQHRRSCGLEMDSDAVLDVLAASEGGGFSKNWQQSSSRR
jgi:hypothetical protein